MDFLHVNQASTCVPASYQPIEPVAMDFTIDRSLQGLYAHNFLWALVQRDAIKRNMIGVGSFGLGADDLVLLQSSVKRPKICPYLI